MVKEIVKRANNTLKSRVIPPEILEKYREKVQGVEPQITKILKEEYEERLVNKMENRANRAQKLLQGENDPHRPWFQSQKERMKEKERLNSNYTEKSKQKVENKNKGKEGNKKNNKKKVDPAEERENNEMKKVAKLQARMSKKKTKPSKIIAVQDNDTNQNNSGKRKRQSFFKDLSDTSNKNAKRLRYDANFKKKMDGKMKAKTGGNKKGGKAFGKPQKKKSRF